MCADLSVIIPTYNPNKESLARVLNALQDQTLPARKWELIVIDNASTQFPEREFFEKHATRDIRIIKESRKGLTAARKCGFKNAQTNIVIFVDDDNLLAPNYLEQALVELRELPQVGTLGGRIINEFPPDSSPWAVDFFNKKGMWQHGENRLISRGLQSADGTRNECPYFCPVGGGMIVRRAAWEIWDAITENDQTGTVPVGRSRIRRGY